MAIGTHTKDPNAVLDYQIDWSTWLDGDTIATSAWIVETGITVDSDTIHDTTSATLWLSGGTVGSTYECTNRITTAGGRTDDRTIKIKIKEL
jgi:hypothetical protein